MEFLSPISLEEIYDEDMADIFVTVMLVIGCIGVISSITVFLIALFKSPVSMKKFRFYLLSYVFCNLVLELDILLYKPVYIPVFIIVYPRGLLSPIDDVTSKLLFGMLLASGFGSTITFVTMLIERYSAMSINGPLSIRNFYRHPTFYMFSNWVFFFIVIILLFSSLFLFNICRPTEETFTVVQRYVIGGEKLLSFQPRLIRLNQDVFKYVGPVFLIYICIITIEVTIFFFLCIYSFRKYSPNYSSKTLENNKMLFKSICFQFLTALLMVIVPILIFIVVVTFNISSKYVNYFNIAIIWTFPIVDDVVIIMTITPYRKFVTSKMKWLIPSKVSQVNSG